MCYVKRVCDIVFSLIGIIFLAPLWIFLAFLVKWSIPGTVLFRQERVGYGRKRFRIWKFRSMVTDADTEDIFESSADICTPAVGRWIRRLKLDELPQMYNILIGDMSFVGPRPYIEKESQGLPAERFSMRPGLTGLAQVYGNRELSWDERNAYDITYVQGFSLLLDLKILLRTVLVVMFGEKACVKHIITKD